MPMPKKPDERVCPRCGGVYFDTPNLEAIADWNYCLSCDKIPSHDEAEQDKA